jgi:hypothetical protein
LHAVKQALLTGRAFFRLSRKYEEEIAFMDKLINFLKTVFCFPIYVRKIHVINQDLQRRLSLLEKSKKETEDNLIYTNTVISSYLSKDLGLNTSTRNHTLTVSLTSYYYRVDKVHLTIQSLMDQELKADRIALYLDELKFSPSNIPKDLEILVHRGLTINYCKDIGPYTKLVPALKQYSDEIIITTDDDLIYPRSFIRKLYESYIKDPGFIHCYRMHYIKLNSDGKAKPYKEWDIESGITDPCPLVFPTGVGGVLYPPNALNEEVFNEEAFLSLSPGADDVWFKAMSLLNGVECKKINSDIMNHENAITIRGTQEIGLHHQNLKNGKNDHKIEDVFNTYKLWDKLKT